MLRDASSIRLAPHRVEPPSMRIEPSSVDPERNAMRAPARESIDPEIYRTVSSLCDVEELETDEVARHLGVTANAGKICVHRARQALRNLLDPHTRGLRV